MLAMQDRRQLDFLSNPYLSVIHDDGFDMFTKVKKQNVDPCTPPFPKQPLNLGLGKKSTAWNVQERIVIN